MVTERLPQDDLRTTDAFACGVSSIVGPNWCGALLAGLGFNGGGGSGGFCLLLVAQVVIDGVTRYSLQSE